MLTIGRQLTEMPELHLKMSKHEAKDRAAELLDLVGIPNAETRLGDYPHQFSGGMRQTGHDRHGSILQPPAHHRRRAHHRPGRDHPSAAARAHEGLVSKFDSSLVIVTHNLGVVARYAQTLYIMYAGRIVESGTCKEIFARPRHPYTQGLLRCVPRIDEGQGRELEAIPGLPPNLTRLPGQCAFLPRCPDERRWLAGAMQETDALRRGA